MGFFFLLQILGVVGAIALLTIPFLFGSGKSRGRGAGSENDAAIYRMRVEAERMRRNSKNERYDAWLDKYRDQ